MVNRITLDLGSTIPEYDTALNKVDFGQLQLELVPDGGGNAKPIARVPYAGSYDKGAYDANVGVVDIPASRFLTPVSVNDMKQHLRVSFVGAGGKSQVGLEEQDDVAETDDRGVYVNEPGAPWSPPDPTVQVQVRYRGVEAVSRHETTDRGSTPPTSPASTRAPSCSSRTRRRRHSGRTRRRMWARR